MKSKYKSRLIFIAVFLMSFIIIAGCSSEKNETEAVNKAEKAAKTDTVVFIAPDEVVWQEGTPLTAETVREVIYIRTSTLDIIYAIEEEKQLGLAGTVTLNFVILPDGSVEDVSLVEADWNDPIGSLLTDKMIDLVAEWTFPPGAKNPISMTQPFRFEPK